jgi:hypothetical protein
MDRRGEGWVLFAAIVLVVYGGKPKPCSDHRSGRSAVMANVRGMGELHPWEMRRPVRA